MSTWPLAPRGHVGNRTWGVADELAGLTTSVPPAGYLLTSYNVD